MTHLSDHLSAHLDGELGPDAAVRLRRHLENCGRCVSELEELQRVRAAVRSLPALELPPDVVPLRSAEPIPAHRNRGMWVGVAAAAVAALIAVAALLTPDPSTVSIDDLQSRFGARASLDPAFGPAKVVVPEGVTE